MTLYCIVKEYAVHGDPKIDVAFIGDLETARETFNNTKTIKLYSRYLTLLEIDVSGLVFRNFSSIPFSRLKEIDHDSYSGGA